MSAKDEILRGLVSTRAALPELTPLQIVEAMKGPQGEQGPEGERGPQGDQGPAGEQGPTGERGPQGAKGDDGKPGTVGTPGERGPRGEQGPKGDRGPRGYEGGKGDKGERGLQGFDGPVGAGRPGVAGAAGTPGTPGAVGPAGPAGPKGDTGAKGDKGDTGATGAQAGLVLYFDNVASDLTLPTVTGTIYAAVNSNPDTITRSSGSFVTAGFKAGMKIKTTGFATPANNGTFAVTIVAADTLTLATIHALTAEAAGATVTISVDREKLTRVPPSGTEVDESQSVVLADGGVPIDTYTTLAGVPGALEIATGTWELVAWGWVSAGTTTTLKFEVCSVTALGASTVLFTTAATTLTATSLATAQKIIVQHTIAAAIPLLETDRLTVRVIANNSSTTARVAHFVYQGTSRASHVATTLNVTAPIVYTPPIRSAAGVPSGAPSPTEIPFAIDTTAGTGGLYYWSGSAWVALLQAD